jgi:hypothetical protein
LGLLKKRKNVSTGKRIVPIQDKSPYEEGRGQSYLKKIIIKKKQLPYGKTAKQEMKCFK